MGRVDQCTTRHFLSSFYFILDSARFVMAAVHNVLLTTMRSKARALRQRLLVWTMAFLGLVFWSSSNQVRLSSYSTRLTKPMEQVAVPISTRLYPIDEVDSTATSTTAITSTSTTPFIRSLAHRNVAISSSTYPPPKTMKSMIEDAFAADTGADTGAGTGAVAGAVTGTDVCEASIDYAAIAQRRHIQHPHAAQLLQRMVEHDKQLSYNDATDLVVFDHVLKTSGTSFSMKLDDIFHSDAIVPGSRPSGQFQKTDLTKAMPGSTEPEQLRDFWQHQKAMYSHTLLLQPDGNTVFQDWLLSQIPNKKDSDESVKRVLAMTLFRDPLDWLASNYYEWMCTLGARIEETHRGLYPHKETPTDHPNQDSSCWGMANLTLLADYWHQHTLPQRCKEGKAPPLYCRTLKETGEDPMIQCRSIDHLIQHKIFRDKMQHNPRFLTQANASESLVELEERSFRVYGGIQPHSRIPLRWIGLTERYDESLILFHDWLGLPMENVSSSLRSDPKERFKHCRPLSFWTNDDIAKVKKLLSRPYVVHNVANAILDARMAVWCCRQVHNEDPLTRRFCNAESMTNA